MKKVLCCGAGGFIGSHLVKRLKHDGHYVIGIDRKQPEFEPTVADEFYTLDLRGLRPNDALFAGVTDVYQLAAEMGGASYIFTGKHDALIMRSNAQININVLEACVCQGIPNIFFSSSACVYPTLGPFYKYITTSGNAAIDACRESDAGNPDSPYGWEKLFSEHLYGAYARNHGLTVRIGRLHNIYGTLGTWRGGREKAPAAICRKVAEIVTEIGQVEVFGDGTQCRSFCYIDDCIEGIVRLMRSGFQGPVNIGSQQMVTIDDLVYLVADIARKPIVIKHVEGPVGVQGRNSDNDLIREKLGWAPVTSLEVGLHKTYPWIAEQVALTKVEA